VSKQLAVQPQTTGERAWQDSERIFFNQFPQRLPEESVCTPLEYAFHLLGDIRGKTVIDLGCGDGENTVIFALGGARVLSIDNSERCLKATSKRAIAAGVSDSVELLHSDAANIPMAAGSADAVFAAGILRHVDAVYTARQIRRVLKPGGTAVFLEPIARSTRLAAIKHVSLGQRTLTMAEVEAVCRAVGLAGRRQAFWLTMRLMCRLGASRSSPPAKAAERLDAAVLRRFPFTRKFASPLVWEARKES